MPVYKRKYGSGKATWYYMFSLPGSTRQDRRRIPDSGFSSKREAEDAEARRRIEEQQKLELAKAGASAPHVFIGPAHAGRNNQLTPTTPQLTRLAC